jgi:3-hydroxyisobutyrate dehydrogenase-like beta-hydroxyacid dehydrogenase
MLQAQNVAPGQRTILQACLASATLLQASAAAAGVKGMLLKRSRLRPACMTVQLLNHGDEASQQLLQDDAAAEATPIMQVCNALRILLFALTDATTLMHVCFQQSCDVMSYVSMFTAVCRVSTTQKC